MSLTPPDLFNPDCRRHDIEQAAAVSRRSVAGDGGPRELGTPNGTAAFTAPGCSAKTSGATYHPLTPARLLDTRSGVGLSGKLVANTPATFGVSGRGGVPAGATGVTGNLTVTGSSAGWAVYLGPAPVASPTSSTINFTKGQVLANGLTVALSTAGALSATYMSTTGATTDLVFDVTGFFTP